MTENMIKYIENLAVNKFFKKSNDEIVRNDILDYVASLKIKAGVYEKMHGALRAIERLEGEDSVNYVKEQFSSFREMSHFYFL
jgi:hypothetical protein